MVEDVYGLDGRSLNLWKRQLLTVPAWVYENPKLESLILADNGLAALPEEIGALARLHTLDLGHNRGSTLRQAQGSPTSEECTTAPHHARVPWQGRATSGWR